MAAETAAAVGATVAVNAIGMADVDFNGVRFAELSLDCINYFRLCRVESSVAVECYVDCVVSTRISVNITAFAART